eukprot:TRINITY_DN28139_c0_g1_i3.p1 TRINITY_DN28139_c0_g1~~TRINITY_DN28139_c0_g1_i3.p1  ORF type:complete len:263 (-),score=66.95 TRINITY_DN28139_c0_g1_i3:562-1350(-)
MLCDHRFTQCIRWDHDGKRFHVLNEDRLAKEVLPIFFKHSNIASFVRQLHTYGFKKLPKCVKSSVSGFEHENFQRGKPELLVYITRKASDALSRQKSQILTLQSQIDELRKQNAQLTEDHAKLNISFKQLVAVISYHLANTQETKDALNQFLHSDMASVLGLHPSALELNETKPNLADFGDGMGFEDGYSPDGSTGGTMDVVDVYEQGGSNEEDQDEEFTIGGGASDDTTQAAHASSGASLEPCIGFPHGFWSDVSPLSRNN